MAYIPSSSGTLFDTGVYRHKTEFFKIQDQTWSLDLETGSTYKQIDTYICMLALINYMLNIQMTILQFTNVPNLRWHPNMHLLVQFAAFLLVTLFGVIFVDLDKPCSVTDGERGWLWNRNSKIKKVEQLLDFLGLLSRHPFLMWLVFSQNSEFNKHRQICYYNDTVCDFGCNEAWQRLY